MAPGKPAKGDFTGWGGLGPVAIMLESVFGLRPDVPSRHLLWDVRLTEAHGVEQYPYGVDGTLDLKVQGRKSAADEPVVEIKSDVDLTLEVRWSGKRKIVEVKKSV
jgi:hypothetical protein